MEDSFKVTSYGWTELALKFSPQLQPGSASKQLMRWVMLNPELVSRLTQAGWYKGARRLTPRQVSYIIQFLGEP